MTMTDTDPVELVRRTMGELLEAPGLAATDNLFAAGGDSLAAIRLAWRLSEATGVELNVADDILAEPTPEAIGRRLQEHRAGAAGSA